jgi:hypothetical protein
MRLLRRFRAIAAILAVAAILASGFAVGTSTARPKDCPYCCMDIPFPPYYVCWHCCP